MNTRQTPDAFLVERAQRGDASALDTLISRHQERAYVFAFRLTRDMDVAADVVANSFVRIYRSINSFRGQSAFTTWMYRIITNCFLDLKKKGANLSVVSLDASLEKEDGESLEMQIPNEGPSAFDEALRSERNKVVEEAVLDLPEYQRAILFLYHVEMLSYEEIAETLEMPIGTVKSRLNRARTGLSMLMGDHRSLFDEASMETIAA